nr:MAG TPA: hypothetical protein [Caudoviricetes sp.]
MSEVRSLKKEVIEEMNNFAIRILRGEKTYIHKRLLFFRRYYIF